uniref:Tc1-like transposase DDE domain-containing protein n=1 Tax=Latimeria chalumnae TaxID=7897 RepID=H2ZS87_LATCH
DSTFFQQDGAPCHYALLNAVFPDKWIGRHGPIAWPLCSPDLSPLDYVLWGYVKTVVYSSKPQSLDELRARITSAIHEITQQQLENVFNELENRIERC